LRLGHRVELVTSWVVSRARGVCGRLGFADEFASAEGAGLSDPTAQGSSEQVGP
jgi:hypothetical protein